MKKLGIGLIIIIVAGTVTYFLIANAGKKPTRRAVTNEEMEVPFTHQGDLVFIDGTTSDTIREIQIEVADTPDKTAQGLMYRSSMKENQGMLFIFPDEEERSFYMKNTRISLDLLFVNQNKEVVSITKYAVPFDLTSIPSNGPATYVVEVIGGFCNKYDIEPGDKIEFTRF